MPELQDSTARPLKFQEIADNLRRAILAGTWAVGQRLPTEQQLVHSSGYSLNTVRRALDLLVEEGLAERRQGAGTFVLPRSSPRTARQTVGVLLPDTSLYYPRVLHGIESTLSAQRASLQLSSYGYDPGKEDACIEHLLSAGADGLLLVPTLAGIDDPQARVEELLRLPVPVVLVERHLAELGVADRSEHVCSDHAAGAYDALAHLHGLGHTRIALLLRGRSPTGVGVAAGYQRAVTDLDLAGELVLRAEVAQWEAGHAETAIEHIRSWGATAALVFGDREAMFVLRAARRHGLRVPEDLALVSYDDELADVADVPLTAVSPPKHRIGRMAAELLLQRLREGAECPQHQIRIRPRLVVRESCGAAAPGATALPPH
ncbi:substrate-binding domain-containing protein [Ruania rhizosphaerae]|uniref:substrate-binding domain-containing protein n=1 Tax=Ruania rhizosphaerae TaxID=1840413 RepID=UPI00135804CA|nr:substrate-binding domain-containing protein [Ruania rhizosphaerae]